MADTEWWQRGPVDGVPAVLQPVAHILLQVRESVGELVESLTEDERAALSARVDAAVEELRVIDVTTLGDFRGVGRAQLPSTVIGCLVHGAEHAMRHVGQLSVTTRVVRSGRRVSLTDEP